MQLGRPQAIIGTEDLLLSCSAKSCSVSQKTIATYSSPNSSIPSEDMTVPQKVHPRLTN
jgi:hypothetical protein